MKGKIGCMEVEGTAEEIYALAILVGKAGEATTPKPEAAKVGLPVKLVPDHDFWYRALGREAETFIRERLDAGADEGAIATVMYNIARDSGVKTERGAIVKEIYRMIEEARPRPNMFKKNERPVNASIDWVGILGVSAMKYATRRLTEGATPEKVRNELFIAAEPKVNIRRAKLNARCRLIANIARSALEKKILEAKPDEMENKGTMGLGSILNNIFAQS